ncbi:MAG: DNA-binding response regulator [Actinobacteria bacterium]|nr:DNA-binding response regulator [Actinomycetota bacterium]
MVSRRIAILEDHPLMLRAVSSNLALHLPDTEFIYQGKSISEALTAIDVAGCDLVLLDLDLGDGIPPIQNLEKLLATGTPVLIVSALAEQFLVRQALTNGASGFISKNANESTLIDAVTSIISGENYMSADIATILLSDKTDPGLSAQEKQALSLYASGLKLDAVARSMNLSRSTASEYIQRARKKYIKVGVNLPTKTDLYRQAQKDGLLP